jgi:hypothetical protein
VRSRKQVVHRVRTGLSLWRVAAEQPWAPTHNQDQSCAFCGASRPSYRHRLDPAHVKFRVHGKGYTLPTFWAACSRCEEFVAAGDDGTLLSLMAHEGEDRHLSLVAFRAADLGSEPLPEGPPDTVQR